jgi:hypothetical protein
MRDLATGAVEKVGGKCVMAKCSTEAQIPKTGGGARFEKALGRIVGLLALLQVILALVLLVNNASSSVVMSMSESFHMQYFMQFAEGGHCYYPRNDVWHVSDGYTPLASEIFGWVIRLLGPDIKAVRLVAGLFGLLGMWLCGLCVKRLSGSRFLAFVAAGLCAGVEIKWHLDVGPNTLHAVFAVLGLYLFLRDPRLSYKTLAAAGLALFASFWCKQLGLAYMLAATIYVLVQDRRKGVIFGLGLLLLSAGAIQYYARLEGAQFKYWVFEFNQHQPLVWARLWTVVFREVLTRKYAVCAVLVLAGLLTFERTWRGLFRPELLLLGAAGAAGALAQCKYGSGPSQMWPFYMFLIVVGLSYGEAFVRQGLLSRTLFGALLIMQNLALWEDPRPYFINKDDEARYAQVFSLLSTAGKKVYWVNHGYVGYLAGQPAYPMAGIDCWNKGKYDVGTFPAERRAYIESDPWDMVIVDVPLEDNSFVLYERLQKAYEPVSEIPASDRFSDIYDLRYRKVIFARKSERAP